MNRQSLIDTALSLLMPVLLVVLAADLLYLYYAGGWYDPIRIIEITEVLLLYVIILVAMFRIISILRGISR